MKKYITIPGFEQLTAQQVFDMGALHLLKQNERSVTPTGRCVYRGPSGLMCGAGVFLEDEGARLADKGRVFGLSSVSFVNTSWSGLVMGEHIPPCNSNIITQLQVLHDNAFPDTWSEKLRNIAKEFSLSTAAIDAFIQENAA